MALRRNNRTGKRAEVQTVAEDPLRLTDEQHHVIDRALLSISRMREFVIQCDKAKLFQLSALYRRMALDLEETIQSQLNENRFNNFPSHWSTEEKQKLLREV